MMKFPVSEEKNRWLQERMESLGIHENDIEENFIRSSGSGGQKINKTSTCVFLKHIPTGIEIKYMKERNQSLNRFLARRELIKRIEKLSGQLTPEDIKIEKTKRQKLKRRKRSRLKYAIHHSPVGKREGGGGKYIKK
jgi:protein subunit release factor B